MKTKELYLYSNTFNLEYKILSSFFFEYEAANTDTIISYFKKNNYDNICFKILTKYMKNSENIKYGKHFEISKNLNIGRYYFNDLVNKLLNKNILILTNVSFIVNEIINFNNKVDVQYYENEEINSRDFINIIENGKNNKNISSFKFANILNYLTRPTDKKYDNIICKNNEFMRNQYGNIFYLTKIPNLLFLLIHSIRQLNKGGNIFLYAYIMKINNTLKKTIYLLIEYFEDIEIINNRNNKFDGGIVLYFKNYKKYAAPKIIQKMVDICINTRQYNYSLCQYIHYLYYINKYKTQKSGLHSLNYNGLDILKKHIQQVNLKILDDIDINPRKTKEGEFIILQLEKIYDNYFSNLNYTIKSFIKIDNKDNIIIDDGLFEKIQYNRLLNLFEIYKRNKIPFNKTYLAYINKYNKNVSNNFYGFRENIHFHLVKYVKEKRSIKQTKQSKKTKQSKQRSRSKKRQKQKSILKSNQILGGLGNYKEYHYDDFDNMQEANILGYKVKQSLLEQTKTKKINKSVRAVTEGLARGVSAYVQMNYKLPHKTSNGYMKLWEIYNTVPNLISNKKHIKVFHLAEAPGQWINCTKHYLETKKHKVEEYDWVANSLNHKHPTNIKKFGKGIFSDDYGFIKRYPDRWLYGTDNTGDITKGKNVEWFNNYMREWEREDGKRIDLITGDAGMVADIPLVDLQKIEYAQICMVAASASIGTNCVIKHFLNFINSYPNSYYGTGYLVNYLYLYYLMFKEIRLIKPHTSNPNSREFYVVGLGFHGIEEQNLKRIIKQLDNYQENHCLFKKDDIPEDFYKQVVSFSETIFRINNEQYDAQTMLMTCIVNPDPVIEKATNCRKYLDAEFIKKVQTKRYKEWIKTYKFE
jgi:23S rRNA U2552 (ribose-2'-O)-methylase RlmE/FtsJ